jgi:hypothetical protein
LKTSNGRGAFLTENSFKLLFDLQTPDFKKCLVFFFSTPNEKLLGRLVKEKVGQFCTCCLSFSISETYPGSSEQLQKILGISL